MTQTDRVETPRVIGLQCSVALPLDVQGRTVLSGIRKRAVEGRCAVKPLGLDGDEQADLSVHGGLEKAVYAYPSEHFPDWEKQAADRGVSDPVIPGRLGENLTIAGVLEHGMFVGDEWHFPGCVLRVAQPRIPCAKLNAVMADPRAARYMADSGKCGVYLAVKTPGFLSSGDVFSVKPGARHTPILSLFKVSRLKTRHD